MSLFQKISRTIGFPLLTLATLALGGCGFTPLYGENSAGQSVLDELSDIRIDAPNTEVGREIKYNMLDSMTPGGTSPINPTYRLEMNISSYVQDSSVQQDSAVTRASFVLVASFSLKRLDGTGKPFRASARARSSYNRVESGFANLAAEQDAMRRSAKTVADDIKLQLSVYFHRKAK